MQIEHLDKQTVDGAQLNLDALYQIAPSCFTEAADPKTGEISEWSTLMCCASCLAMTLLRMR